MEADPDAEAMYQAWLERWWDQGEQGEPIVDDDTLASPIGYLAVRKSIYD